MLVFRLERYQVVYAVHNSEGGVIRSVDTPKLSMTSLNAAFTGLTSPKGTTFTFSDAPQKKFTRESKTFKFRIDSMIQSSQTYRVNKALAAAFRTANMGNC